jgi:hypothetical protein
MQKSCCRISHKSHTIKCSHHQVGLNFLVATVMDGYCFSTERVEDWKTFKELALSFSESWAFRGQADGRWLLSNSIERMNFIHQHQGIEAEFVKEFQRGASNYLSKEQTPGCLIEWLALMQHHGAPTRLLDMTWSPFIASFFAFELCPDMEEHWVSIWGINIAHLREKATAFLHRNFNDELPHSPYLFDERLFEQIFRCNDLPFVFPIEPFRMNRRYSLQQSVFLSTGTSSLPFMEQLIFLGADMQKAVVKIEIPGVHRRAVMRELQLMNLHRASLFPDLDGYAASLRLRYESRRPPQELEQQILQQGRTGPYRFPH